MSGGSTDRTSNLASDTDERTASALATVVASKIPSTPAPTRTSIAPRSHGCGSEPASASQAASVVDVSRYRRPLRVGPKRHRSWVTTGATSYPWISSRTVTSAQ